MITFRELMEIAMPAAAFLVAMAVITSKYRRQLKASGRKFKK